MELSSNDVVEIRSYSKKKKSRVNIILTPLNNEEENNNTIEQYQLSIHVKQEDKNYKIMTIEEYFKNPFLAPIILSPFSFLPSRLLGQQYSIKAFPKGGGLSAQSKALTLAIARALVKYYPEMRSSLKKAGLLTQDSRVKERKKIGKYKARRSPQFTKR